MPVSAAREATRGFSVEEPLKVRRMTWSSGAKEASSREERPPLGATRRRAAAVLGRAKISCTVPSSTTWPPSRMATRSQMASTTLIWWVMTTTVMPSFWLISRIRLRMERVVSGSRALVASSHSSTLGSVARARAMATRWRCPPESWAG